MTPRFLRSALSIGAMLAVAGSAFGGPAIRFNMPFDGYVSLNVRSADGRTVRRVFEGQPMSAGEHSVELEQPLPPGEYTWSGLVRRGIGLKLRGWAGQGGAVPWETADGCGGWGGSGGSPSAVAADSERIFLGWSRADEGAAVVAVDLDGRVRWRWRTRRGCVALGVDGGFVFVLTAPSEDGDGASVVRLNATDGDAASWAEKEEIGIASLWPSDAKTKYRFADTMAVRNGRIYLSFTEAGFVAVLDAATGAYVTTLTGPQPGAMVLSTTPMRDPSQPDRMLVADFGIVTIASRAVSYFVMPHDPPWIAANSTRWLPDGERITALAMRGDTMQSGEVQLYLGLDAPLVQVQARPATDPVGFAYEAGKPGGRPGRGPWEPEALARVRALAFDARDRMWVAEDGTRPPRFSVWTTEGETGRVVAEYFGPAKPGAPGGAIHPLDPDLMVGIGCEWRVDPKTGRAACLGVIPGPEIEEARFSVAGNGRVYLAAKHADGSASVFERVGDGDYRLRSRVTASGGVASFWAERSADGDVQEGDRVDFEGEPEDRLALGPDLGIRLGARLFRVRDWTATGAPTYGAPEEGGAAETEDVRGRFEFPPPLGTVRAVVGADGEWRLIAGDGLVLGTLFESDPRKVRWPEAAIPGADMSRVPSGGSSSQMTRTPDGRVFVQAGRTAYWNLEVTGLDTVEALPGGKVAISEEPPR